jgi:hypothetical protein
VRGVKAGFLMFAFGICHVPHPRNISAAYTKLSLAHIEEITIPLLRGAGEDNDTAQIILRAIFSVDGVCTIRTVLEFACE